MERLGPEHPLTQKAQDEAFREHDAALRREKAFEEAALQRERRRVYRPATWTVTYTSNPEGSLVGFVTQPTKEAAEYSKARLLAEGFLVPTITHRKAITGPLHYHAGSGSHGCLYDANDVCETYAGAVETLRQRFELGRKRTSALRHHGYLELRPQDGADYCEIVDCREEECWSGPEGLNAQEPDWIRDHYPQDQ